MGTAAAVARSLEARRRYASDWPPVCGGRIPMTSSSNTAAQIARIFGAAALAAVAAAVGFSQTGYEVGAENPFMWWVLLGIVFIHMRLRFSWADVAVVASMAAAFSYVAFAVRGLDAQFSAACCYIGLASWTVLGIRAIWADAAERQHTGYLPAFVACSFFVGFLYVAAPVLFYAEQLQPKTLDLYLLSFDGSLGFQPSFFIGQYYAAFPWLRRLGLIAYEGLPLALALAYVENLRAHRKRSVAVGLGIFYLGVLGVLAYNLFPATGPIHLFGELFPQHPLGMAEARALPMAAIPVRGSRNAIPSLHMAWILWCWWWARDLAAWAKAVLGGFVVFTVVATLGTGEHYLIDLVVAVPFTLMVLGLFCLTLPWNNKHRLAAVAAGLAGTLGWLVLLRYGRPVFWLSPIVPWGLAMATVGGASWMEWRLMRVLRNAEAGGACKERTAEQERPATSAAASPAG